MKIYRREGRRFVQIPSNLGKYLDENGSFTVEKTPTSIGYCVLETEEHSIVCALEPLPMGITWYNAVIYACNEFNCCGYLPSRAELLMAIDMHPEFFKEMKAVWLWTCNQESKNNAWLVYLSKGDFGLIYNTSKNYGSSSVLPFVKIPRK
jgi:hypothetical protein